MRVPNQAIPNVEKLLQPHDPNARVVDNAVKLHKSLTPGVSSASTPAPDASALPSTTAGLNASTSATPTTADPTDVTKVEESDSTITTLPITADMPKGPFIEDDPKSGIYPYNAYLHPFSLLKRDPSVNPALFATRLQRLLVPAIMPVGLDAREVIKERDRFVDKRIEWRIRELEGMSATMGEGGLDGVLEQHVPNDDPAMKIEPDLADKDKAVLANGIAQEKLEDQGKENTNLAIVPHSQSQKAQAHPFPPSTTHGKLRALIELKSLRVLDKQRALRAMVAERLTHGSLLPLNRSDFRRTRKPTLRDTRMTEQAERKQRVDRERRAKQKHVEQLSIICKHGESQIAENRAKQARILRLGKGVLSFHAHTEREEQKRIERLAKERLKALKADDEVAYMKLIDTAKDTRITHLLRQTDAYLDSLAQAVMEQQKDDPHNMNSHIVAPFEVEEGPTSEATFGAKKMADDDENGGGGEDKSKLDYYAVAHKVKEKVSKQPSLLIGGTLKEYQLKGLQWMVSLYNNKLNGILADEMVRFAPFSP